MDIKFALVKKLTKPLPRAKGITLRSARSAEDGLSASAILMAGGYQKIREEAEGYRLRTGSPLSCRSRGSSLEITASCGEDSVPVLMDFLQGIAFNSENVMEVLEFFRLYLDKGSDSGMRCLALDMSSEDLRIACSMACGAGETAEDVLSRVSALLDRYDMGIIKEGEAPEEEV